ncbi:DUF11 domain-containing protein [Maribacter flavus]|uniref:DUF11 domain-containing protein n=1 Tax=Maribacter flavus TaxID=1658664 RepID=A0A5B2TV90_9FLAO|nr:DUF11 domain-containing protein [Maribacter flavus]
MEIKKLGLLILFLIFGILKSNAQLSDLHYLPPLKQGSNNSSVKEQAIYMSTPESTAFTVNAYRGTSTIPIASFSISNATPARYDLPNGDNGITMVQNNDTGIVITTGGLRFESTGGQRFYVNYRGSSGAQSTSLTSKGRQAMGTNFKWGGAPNYATTSDISTSLGIMATENNTTVDIFGYNPGCEFRLQNDRDGILDDAIQVVLNAGESFVLEAYTTETAANVDGWLGASITSDKNIVISNGGLNYGVVPTSSSSRDAGIDQPVPEDNLGKDYVFIRGGGQDSTEFPIIIATQNNTQIFVNGNTTPMATINEGDYFIVPGTNYSSASPGANMYVRTSKDAYAYQNLAGSTGVQTVGLNFVAPLNCLIPDKVDNIPDITDAAGTTLNGGITIIASATTPDANIVVTDGSGAVTKPAALTISGNTDWKTFYIPNLTGNVDVQSTGPIAVGFFGANGNRGIAGYFSGFDVAPNVDLQITGTQCLPGSNLEVVGEVFDAYQWFYEGNPISGATSDTYNPTVAGDYYVRVTKGPCTYDSNTLAAYYCNPDIQLIKTADQTMINEGENITFTITVQNFGVDPATNLVVTDALPTGLSLLSASPSTGSWTSPNWNVGTLNSGQLETITITAVAVFNSLPNQIRHLANIALNTQNQVDSNLSLDRPSVAIIVNNDFDNDGIIDVVDLDDDNDGILDCTESNGTITNGTFGWYLNTPSGTLAMDNTSNPELNSWFLSSTSNLSYSGITASTPFSAVQIDNMPSTSLEEALYNNDYIEVSFTTADNLSNPILHNINWGWYQPSGGDSYTMSAFLSADGFISSILTKEDLVITNNATTYQVFDLMDQTFIPLLPDTTYTLRVYVYNQIDDDGENYSFFDDINFTISSCRGMDSDSDNVIDSYELDSDNDGCSDSNEAYNNINADGGDDMVYGSGVPSVNANGTVVAAAYPTPADMDTNGTPEFQEAGNVPTITVAPANSHTFVNTNDTFSSTDDGDTYQWQVSTDGGTTFTDISDGPEYSGTTTNTLTIITPEVDKNGYQYRVLIASDTFVCGNTVSSPATLTVGPRTIITNRRITFRVNKN